MHGPTATWTLVVLDACVKEEEVLLLLIPAINWLLHARFIIQVRESGLSGVVSRDWLTPEAAQKTINHIHYNRSILRARVNAPSTPRQLVCH